MIVEEGRPDPVTPGSDTRLRGGELLDTLVRVEIRWWNAIDHRLREDLRVSLPWYEALHAIGNGSDRVREVATALSITAGGASKIASALIEGALAARGDDHTDARAAVLNLASSGADLLRASLAVVDDEVRTLIGDRLGDADSDMLLALLRRLR